MKQTVLHPEHLTLGAKMAPFAGYRMPIQYPTGILREHELTRTAATVFDTCHMGEFLVEGRAAADELDRLVSCDVASLEPGRCRYGLLCNPAGGVLDDLVVYRLTPERFMVVNAGTQETDLAWLQDRLRQGVTLADVSTGTAKIDLQGPGSVRVLQHVLDAPIPPLDYYRFVHGRFGGKQVLVSRTGYTGEAGFEVYCGTDLARQAWQRCLERGAAPAGLGARDTLRLEMGFPLYGHELCAEWNAAESAAGRAVARTKTFVGADAIRRPDAQEFTIAGLVLTGRRAARAGSIVRDAAGSEIGHVTSGSFAPSLRRAIALARVRRAAAPPGARLLVCAGNTPPLEAVVTPLPFYSSGTARARFADLQ